MANDLFNLKVDRRSRVAHSYLLKAKGYSDYGTLLVSEFDIAIFDSTCGKYQVGVTFADGSNPIEDEVIDYIELDGGTEERNQMITDILADVSDTLIKKKRTLDTTMSVVALLVGELIPMIIDADKRRINFPVNTLVTTSFLKEFIGDEEWLVVEWKGEKSFTDVITDFIISAIEVVGKMTDALGTKDDDDDVLESVEEARKSFGVQDGDGE